MALVDIKSMFEAELLEDFKKSGYPAYRARQVYLWLVKGVKRFGDMRNLPKSLIGELSEKYYIVGAEIARKLVSKIDGTIKYLFRLNDGEYIEAVVMSYRHGYTICISTQVGCKMGCRFCATGKGGFARNLTASEMISQIKEAELDSGIRISNVVLMGMGEPLDNYENVVRFLRLVSSAENLNIGMRHISLSTCGIIDKICKLAEEKFQLTLSVSLHAPDDLTRSKIMPISKKYSLDDLLAACRFYISKTNRRISFEYAMIAGVNDSDECARLLAEKLRGMLCHVNLIPANDVDFAPGSYKKSGMERIKKFVNILEKYGINVTIRRTLGADINASCGQLRRSTKTVEV